MDVLALVFAAVWLLLWRASRRARLWFVVVAPILAALCLPLAIEVGRFDTSSACRSDASECGGDLVWVLMFNGMVAFRVTVLLGLLTLPMEVCRSMWRRWRSTRRNVRPTADGVRCTSDTP